MMTDVNPCPTGPVPASLWSFLSAKCQADQARLAAEAEEGTIRAAQALPASTTPATDTLNRAQGTPARKADKLSGENVNPTGDPLADCMLEAVQGDNLIADTAACGQKEAIRQIIATMQQKAREIAERIVDITK